MTDARRDQTEDPKLVLFRYHNHMIYNLVLEMLQKCLDAFDYVVLHIEIDF